MSRGTPNAESGSPIAGVPKQMKRTVCSKVERPVVAMDVQGHAERRVGVADSRRDRVAQAAQIGRLWHGPGGTLTVAACATGGPMVVAEEHHSEDRLGSAVI